jgi:hypothetical protein
VINGFNLKWLYVKRGPFDPNYDPNGPYLNYDFDTITERIGGCRYYDIFYSFCYGGTESDPLPCDKIRCYSDSTFGLYSTGISTSCDYYTTSVEESELNDLNFSIYPNPAYDQVTLTYFIEPTDEAVIEIYNLLGDKVAIQTLDADATEQTFSVALLNSGVYLYKYSINGKIIKSDKLVIVK